MNEDEKYLFDLMGYLVIPNGHSKPIEVIRSFQFGHLERNLQGRQIKLHLRACFKIPEILEISQKIPEIIKKIRAAYLP